LDQWEHSLATRTLTGLFATTNGCRLVGYAESEAFGDVDFW